jgi:hypothetical protein
MLGPGEPVAMNSAPAKISRLVVVIGNILPGRVV